MEVKDELSRLTTIVEQMGEAVISTSQTVESLAQRVEAIAFQVQNQGHQVQQQSYQIFALSDALQNLVDHQSKSQLKIDKLIEVLQEFIYLIKIDMNQ